MSALEVSMMKRIGELNAEIKSLKAEVERLTSDNEELKNRCDFLEGKQP